MNVVIIVGLLAMLCAYLESIGKLKYGLKIAFGIITVFAAIRYDFGNDYMGYLDGFNRYKNYHGSLFDIEALIEMQGHGDYGWVFLNLIASPIGFFNFVILLSILENWIIYDFVKTYVPKKWYAMAIFIFVFNPNLMVLGCSMMRQWLAICIFVFSFRFIRDRKPILYFIFIFIAISIHGSARILLPFYFITYLKGNSFSLKRLFWFVPLLVGWFVIAPHLLVDNLEWLFSLSDVEAFSIYDEGSTEQYGILGIVAYFLFPIVCLSQIRRFDPDSRLLILLSFITIILWPFGLIISMILRLSFYFMIFSVVVYPMVMEKLQKINTALVFVFLPIVIIPAVRDFFTFFQSPVWIEYFSQYHTIFSVSWQ